MEKRRDRREIEVTRRRSDSEVAQSCPTLSNPMDCSPLGSSIHGTLQARVLEWVAIAFSVSIFLQLLNSRTQTKVTIKEEPFLQRCKLSRQDISFHIEY